MNKELKDLLDNYEKTIYGQAFPIVPSTHQLHLLLDYIANLDQQVKKQKEVIDRTIEYINVNTNKGIYESGYGRGTALTICKEHLLEILKGDSNE